MRVSLVTFTEILLLTHWSCEISLKLTSGDTQYENTPISSSLMIGQ